MDCTVSDNSATYYGGGIDNAAASITLTGCTISGNSAKYGGGVQNYAGTVNLTACTISGNSASKGGGGLHDQGSSSSYPATASLTDTIVAGNTSSGGNADDIGDKFSNDTGSNNLIGTGGSGGLTNGVNGNIVLTTLAGLGLAPLADNGGPTQTMALSPVSLAIEAGTAVSGVTTDQRGQPLDSPHPDIAPFQFQPGNLVSLTFAGLTNQSVAFGTASATFAGTLANPTQALPPGESVAITLDDVTQQAAIAAGGGFSTTFATAGLSAAGSPYTISYSYARDGTFASAITTSTLTVMQAAGTVRVQDPGGTYNGTAFSAAATVAGLSGSAAASLEGVTPSLNYYSGTYTSTAQLSGLTPLAGTPARPARTQSWLARRAADYTTGSALASFNIAPATPTVHVTDSGGNFTNTPYPAVTTVTGVTGSTAASLEGVTPALTYYSGTHTSTAQLSGLTPLAGTPSLVGQYTVMASFAGSADYTTGSELASFTISRATPTLTVTDNAGKFTSAAYPAVATVAGSPAARRPPAWRGATPSLNYYGGTYATAAQLSGLNPLAGAPSLAGQYTVLAAFAGSADYTTATALASFTIAKTAPQVTWSAPSAIVYGTPLGAAQLDASANVPGTFAYNPVVGRDPGAGSVDLLTATFMPADSTDYSTGGAATAITVLQATPTLKLSAPGGTCNGSPFAASVTITGTAAGVDDTPAADVEVVAASLPTTLDPAPRGTSLGTTPPTVPAYTVVASFAGSPDYTSTQSAPVNFTIARGAAAVALASPTGSSVIGPPLTFVATAIAAGGTPGGMVAFFDGATPLGNAQLDGSGKAYDLEPGLRAQDHRQLRRWGQLPGRDLGFRVGVSFPGWYPRGAGAARGLQEETAGLRRPDCRRRAPRARRGNADRHGQVHDQEEDARDRDAQRWRGDADGKGGQRAQKDDHHRLQRRTELPVERGHTTSDAEIAEEPGLG